MALDAPMLQIESIDDGLVTSEVEFDVPALRVILRYERPSELGSLLYWESCRERLDQFLKPGSPAYLDAVRFFDSIRSRR